MSKDKPVRSKLYGLIVFILMKAGVTAPEIDECIEWAFGKGAWYVSPAEWVGRWNKLHPDGFRASPRDKFVELVYVVGHLFTLWKQKKFQKILEN